MRRRTEEDDENNGDNSSDVCLLLGLLVCMLNMEIWFVSQVLLLNIFDCSMPCRKRKKG